MLEAVNRQVADAERRLKRMLHELEDETPKDDEGQTPQPSDAAFHWGRVAIQHDPVSRAKYDAMKAQGKTHGRALRQVVDRLLSVACAMLRDRTVFETSRNQVIAA